MGRETKGSEHLPAEEPPEWEPPEWWGWVRGAVYVGVYAVVLQLLKLAVLAVWPKVSFLLHAWWATFIGTVLVLLVGVGLFVFKKHYQRFYGLAEIGFALVVTWASLVRAKSANDAASWIAVLAAAYLIVRGLNNYQEGKNAQELERRRHRAKSFAHIGQE